MTKAELIKQLEGRIKVKAKNPKKYLNNKYSKFELEVLVKRLDKSLKELETEDNVIFTSYIVGLAKDELAHNDYIHNLKLEGIHKTYKGYVRMFAEDLEMAFMYDDYIIIDDSKLTYK